MDFYLLLKSLVKKISNKYSQKLVHSVKKSATDAIKTVSKRAIQKTAEATGDLSAIILLIRLHVCQKNLQRNYIHWSCLQKSHLQMTLILNYQKNDIYLHKKDNKLLMN